MYYKLMMVLKAFFPPKMIFKMMIDVSWTLPMMSGILLSMLTNNLFNQMYFLLVTVCKTSIYVSQLLDSRYWLI